VATVHALTIHKSQGSEYDHAIVVLPEARSRLLTRELLYTGVTRAAKRVTVIGSREVIEAAIRRPIRRATGLAGRL
jgi:exodeoxyribonuclease V alpha subunit